MTSPRRRRIGVLPDAALTGRARLLAALEAAYPVTFVGAETAPENALDAVVAFPQAAGAPLPPRAPSLRFLAEEGHPGATAQVELADDPALSRPLRGARLSETHGTRGPTTCPPDAALVLAHLDGAPGWWIEDRRGPAHHTVTIAPAELGPRDALRSRLAPGRCLGLLALTQLMLDVCGESAWQPPPLRAAFVIDDPNLRRSTYGHIDYRHLAASAADVGYHVSIAMVPLDARAVHSTPAGLFAEHREQLSLCVHGNDHLRYELQHPRTPAEASVPIAQALMRLQAFERRTGLNVDRVMVAPHERLGEAIGDALVTYGFEGLSGTRLYPWLPEADDLPWLARPAHADALVGWRCAEVLDNGLLALLRLDLGHPREEFVIRAFLGQPIIMYGHDDLLRDGPGELERAAQEIHRFGDVRWQNLGSIARSSVATRRSGETLEARITARRTCLDVPTGVRELVVHRDAIPVGEPLAVTGAVRAMSGAGDGDGATARYAVAAAGPVEIAFGIPSDPRSVPLPRTSVRSIARRLAAEGRDRARPRLARMSR